MSSVDISRKLFQPAKHYAGAVYQQGRVTLDSDQNENATLAGEELRRLIAEAICGPDTTARLRRMRRVHVATGTAADCTDALAGLGVALDRATGGILSPTTLTVGFDPAGVTDDPCKPAMHAGFLGADNQTFRVQVTAAGRFIRGADNASPLCRVP